MSSLDEERLQAQSRLLIRQRVRLMVNQYEVHAEAPGGGEGELLAFAQQKRLAFKEQVTLYSDDSKTRPILGFKARKRIDLASAYDITDAHGQPIGVFRKDFKKSLLASTWHMEQPGLGVTTGSERNKFVAVLRRVWQIIPYVDSLPFAWPYHFDFYAATRSSSRWRRSSGSATATPSTSRTRASTAASSSPRRSASTPSSPADPPLGRSSSVAVARSSSSGCGRRLCRQLVLP